MPGESVFRLPYPFPAYVWNTDEGRSNQREAEILRGPEKEGETEEKFAEIEKRTRATNGRVREL